MPTDRTYPAADGVDTWYANKSSVISSKDDVVVGTHVGPASAGGVNPPASFEDYIPIHRIDSPSDGINDAANYVVYFQKADESDNLEVYKATDSDISTLVKLTSGAEFDLVDPMKDASFTQTV
jgi:hypothetical protein